RLEGAEATREIGAVAPGTKVLVLTTYADDASLFPALRAGARGYLTKDASAEEIEQAIRTVVAGRTHLDPVVQERLVAAVVAAPARGRRACSSSAPSRSARPSDAVGVGPIEVRSRSAARCASSMRQSGMITPNSPPPNRASRSLPRSSADHATAASLIALLPA